MPRAQRLDASSAPALQDLVEGDPYTSGLNALRADLGWIRPLRDGGRVWVEVEEWVNKSSGRGSITLIGRPAGGGERLERARGVYLGLLPYDQVTPRLFPWADLDVDEDLYDDKESELWELEESIYDSEEGRTIMVGIDFEEWRELRGLTGLRPYEVEAGELARWRLVLQRSIAVERCSFHNVETLQGRSSVASEASSRASRYRSSGCRWRHVLALVGTRRPSRSYGRRPWWRRHERSPRRPASGGLGARPWARP